MRAIRAGASGQTAEGYGTASEGPMFARPSSSRAAIRVELSPSLEMLDVDTWVTRYVNLAMEISACHDTTKRAA